MRCCGTMKLSNSWGQGRLEWLRVCGGVAMDVSWCGRLCRMERWTSGAGASELQMRWRRAWAAHRKGLSGAAALTERECTAGEREQCAQGALAQHKCAAEEEAQLDCMLEELAQCPTAFTECEAALAAQRDKVYAELSLLAHVASLQGAVPVMGVTPSPVGSAHCCGHW